MTRSRRHGAAIRSCCAERLREDGPQLSGFSPKRRHIITADGVCPNNEIKPVDGLFGFFDNDAELGYEIRPGTSGAG